MPRNRRISNLLRSTAVLALLVTAAMPVSAAPLRAVADGLSITLATDPAVVPVGKARAVIEVAEGGKPLERADVRVFIHMPGMDMGEREQAAKPVPGAPGRYVAPAVFAMAGDYVAEVRILTAERERRVTLKLSTGMDTSPGRQAGNATRVVAAILALVLVAFTLYRMKVTGQRLSLGFLLRRNVWISLLLLAAALTVAVYSVRRWRRAGSMTPIEAQAMEMATPPPPGVATVRTAPVDRGAVTASVSYTGQAAGWVEQDVNARVSGWIVDMPVYAGTRVRPRDILARLDTSQIRPVIAERKAGADAAMLESGVAEAEEAQARSAVQKARAEAEARDSAVQSAIADVRAAEADLHAARQELEAANAEVLEARAMLDAAAAEDRYWFAELNRMKALAERGAVSVDELQVTQLQAARAASSVQQATATVRKVEASAGSAQARVRRTESAVEAARQQLEQSKREKAAALAEAAMVESSVTAAHRRKAATVARARQERAMLAQAETLERYTVIRATAEGVVTERRVPPGVYVTAGQTILRLVQSTPIRLQAFVSEGDLPSVRAGARVRVWKPGQPRRILTARVTSVAPFVDPTTRTALVEALWPNQDGSFAVGDTIRMSIEVGHVAAALRVPRAAVSETSVAESGVEARQTRYSVWVLEPGPVPTVRRVVFEPGIRGDDYYEVRSGLAAGARVVVDGWRNLREGDQVTDVSAPPSGHERHQASPESSGPKGHDRKEFTCPMHPDVVRDAPGRCPKCGMALVPRGHGQ